MTFVVLNARGLSDFCLPECKGGGGVVVGVVVVQ